MRLRRIHGRKRNIDFRGEQENLPIHHHGDFFFLVADLYPIISNPLKAAEWPHAILSHRGSTNKAKTQFIMVAEMEDMPAIVSR